ncbi:MAG: F0F1 ATP synthase subunit A [Tissierellales bacterium]|jgi:F-type H+-transporting ATPase subunit a|nr:F0F1 ATP synthase subunit A [Tissierellales bacterium]
MHFEAQYVLQIPEGIPVLGGIWITNTVVSTWIIMAVLVLISILLTRNLKEVPTGKQNVAEAIVGGVNDLVKQTMGEDKMYFAPYMGTLLMYLAFANLSGLLGMRPPTADLNTTFALSILTFAMTQIYGLKAKKMGYLKGFCEPFAFMLPTNIIGELANPISLSFRLFGNILGGVVIMALVYSALGNLAFIPVPAILHAYFDVFSGLIQTFIFVMLSMVFIAMAMDD